MTDITLNTADLSDADIQAALDMLNARCWENPDHLRRSIISEARAIRHLAAALRLIREEWAEHEARNRKVSDAMKVVRDYISSLRGRGHNNPVHYIRYCGVNVTFSDFILPDPVDPIEERAREIWTAAYNAWCRSPVGSTDKAAIAVIADAMRGEGK